MEYIDLLQGLAVDGLTASPVAENTASLHVNTTIQAGLNPLKQRKLLIHAKQIQRARLSSKGNTRSTELPSIVLEVA
eukprot:203400-Prorocentrum_minimum.AAC.1